MSAQGIIPDAGYGGVVVTSLPAPAGITNAYVPPVGFTVSSSLRFYGFNCAANKYDPQQMNAFESEMLALAVKFDPTGTWNTGSVINLANAFDVWVANFSAGGGVTLFTAADYPSSSDLGAATPGYVTTAISAVATFIEALIPSLTTNASYPSSSDTTAATPAYVAHAVSAGATPLTHIAAFPSSSDATAATPAYVSAAIASVAANNLHSLTDVNVTEGAGIDGYSLTWHQATGKWIASLVSGGSSTLASLTDVIITSASNNDALVYEGSGVNKWRNLALGVMAFSHNYNDLINTPVNASYAFSGLSDVNITEGPGIDGYVPTWDNGSSKWIASPAAGGSSTFASLTDVDITAPANGDVATYDSGSSKWKNVAPAASPSPHYTPPLIAGLAAVTNLNSATLTDRVSGAVPSLHVKAGGGGSAGELYGAFGVAPGGTFSVVAKVKTTMFGTGTGWNGAGIALHNSAGTISTVLWLTASNGPALWAGDFSGGFTSGSPSLGTALADGDYFLHADYDGTNIKLGISRNGIDILNVSSVTLASHLVAVTHVGIFWGGAATMEHDFLHFHAGALGTSGL